MKKICFLLAVLCLPFNLFAQKNPGEGGFAGGGYMLHSHDDTSFDGTSVYSASDVDINTPLWEWGHGAYASFLLSYNLLKGPVNINMQSILSYSITFFEGEHLTVPYTAIHNDVFFGNQFSFYNLLGFISPTALFGVSVDWFDVPNSATTVDGTDKAVFFGLGFHIGAGFQILLGNTVLIDITAAYRFCDYFSALYNSTSASTSLSGSGFYVKAGVLIKIR